MRDRLATFFTPRLIQHAAVAFLLAASMLLVGNPKTGTAAQRPYRIAAVVNDDVVTEREVRERMLLNMATSGLPNTPETQRNLLPLVIQTLIDEKLKQQEAFRQNVTVSDDEIKNAKRRIATNNKMTEEQLDAFLKNGGVAPGILETQIKAELSWIRSIQTTLMPHISVEPQEIDAILDSLRSNLGKPQRLASEIVLPVDSPDAEEKILRLARDLAREARQNGNFPALARQFSIRGTAAVGGDLGWVTEGQLDPAVEEAIKGLVPGQISEPIRTSSGYVIILLRDVSIPAPPDPNSLTVFLSQLYMPTQGAAAVSEAKRNEIATTAESARSCDDINRTAAALKLPSSGAIGFIKQKDLPPNIRAVVQTLPNNTPSRRISIPGAEVVVMVCDRLDPKGLPPRQAVEERIGQEKLERAAQRRLRDLRRAALIEVRL